MKYYLVCVGDDSVGLSPCFYEINVFRIVWFVFTFSKVLNKKTISFSRKSIKEILEKRYEDTFDYIYNKEEMYRQGWQIH